MKETTVDVFDAWLESRLQDVHTALPGMIEKYDSVTRRASVKISVRFPVKKGDPLSVPTIDNVPVIFPSAAGFSLTFPLVKGDGVLILFSEEGIGNFLNGQGNEVDADSLARFALTDAICIPGLFPFSAVPQSRGTIAVDEQGNININQGTLGAARQNDATLADATTDPAFEIWRLAFNIWAVALGLPAPMPASRTGKINAGSQKVMIG